MGTSFHIWAISDIAEGIEILTGVKAGEIMIDEETGQLCWEKGTVFSRVNDKLGQMSRATWKYQTEWTEKSHRRISLPAGILNVTL